jgi:hypothetical protein
MKEKEEEEEREKLCFYNKCFVFLIINNSVFIIHL